MLRKDSCLLAIPSHGTRWQYDLIEVFLAGGGKGIPGVYIEGDPKDKGAKQGEMLLDFGKAWVKSPHITAGQAPVMKYCRLLMEAILWGRMDYLNDEIDTQIISMDDAVKAYDDFDEGSEKKFVIDPHGMVKRRTAANAEIQVKFKRPEGAGAKRGRS